MEQPDPTLIGDNGSSQSGYSHRSSPSHYELFTASQEDTELQQLSVTGSVQRHNIESHDSDAVQKDVGRRSTPNPILMSGAGDLKLSEPVQGPESNDHLSLGVQTQDQQIQLVRRAIDALKTISTQHAPFLTESDIRDANEHLLRLEGVHFLSVEIILQTGLGSFLEQYPSCSFPEDTRYCFPERVNSLFLQRNRIRTATGHSQDVESRLDEDHISVSSSVEPTSNTSHSSHSAPVALHELPTLAEHSHVAYNGQWPGEHSATAHPSPDFDHADELTLPFEPSPATMVTSPLRSRRHSPSRPPSLELPSPRPMSPRGATQVFSSGPPLDMPPTSDPPGTPFPRSLVTYFSSPRPEYSSGRILGLDSSPVSGAPSPESFTVPTASRIDASDTVSSIILEIRGLENELEIATELFRNEDVAAVRFSNTAIEIEQQILAKNEARRPLLAARRKIQDQISQINAEIKVHKKDLDAQNEAAMLHVQAKGKAQDLLNVLAAKRRKQKKNLSLAQEKESFEREIADPLLRAIAKHFRGSDGDRWEIDTDLGSATDTDVDSDNAERDEADDDGKKDDAALSKAEDFEAHRPVTPPPPEPVRNDLIHDLAEAYTKVADKDNNEVTMFDLAQLAQAFDKAGGSERVKDDADDRPGIKAEIKREAMIKVEEGSPADNSNITAGVKTENGDQTHGIIATQSDLAALNLRSLTADGFRKTLANMQHHLTAFTGMFALMKRPHSSRSPEPRQFSHATHALARKRKCSEVQDEAIPDLEGCQAEHALKQVKRRSRSLDRDRSADHVETTIKSSPTLQDEVNADSEGDAPIQTNWMREQQRQTRPHPTAFNINDNDDAEPSRPAKRTKSRPTSPAGEGSLPHTSLTTPQANYGWQNPQPELGHDSANGMGMGKDNASERQASIDPDGAVDVDLDEEQRVLVAQPQWPARLSLAGFFSAGARVRD